MTLLNVLLAFHCVTEPAKPALADYITNQDILACSVTLEMIIRCPHYGWREQAALCDCQHIVMMRDDTGVDTARSRSSMAYCSDLIRVFSSQ